MISTCRSSRSKSLASSCRVAALLRPMSARPQPHRSGLPVRSRLMRSLAIFLLGALTFAGPARVHAQSRPASSATASRPAAANGLLVTGAVAQDLRLSLDDLKKMPRKSVSTRDHAGEMHQYDGVPIGAVLAKAGVPQGPALRGKSMALTVVAEGTDGYRAIFSLAELDDDFAAESVLIVDSTDGQPLGPDQGPLRLVVPGDKRPARWVRMLKSITIVNLAGPALN
jgi:DMSO/TMAO reductase YedYZ molybdopterin-dependent catalytic subunit